MRKLQVSETTQY